jgi:endonuclease/exonuclease/phosphatase family metal-dependent hydrolase
VLRRWLRRAGLTSLALSFLASATVSAEPSPLPANGRFEIVTYNVAGLPEGLSNVHPRANLPLIGGMLNKFDVALVQEDFAYPELLRQRSTLPYRSPGFVRGEQLHFGDGLSLFSRFPAQASGREPWTACHGVVDSYFDCLTPKGVAWWRVELTPGISIDVYNVHLDAGATRSDALARQAQLSQLVSVIRRASSERSIVLGGDFNLTAGEVPAFRALMSSIGLVEVCDELRCGQPARLDRLLFRSSSSLRLLARGWRLGRGFRDAQGRALSDHEPVIASFGWQTVSR